MSHRIVAVLAATAVLSFPAIGAELADSDARLAEVVVTAQKKTENLQRASLAVDALSAEDVATQGITNAIDLQDVLPAVRFVAADQMTVLIRGLGTINDNPGVDSSVSYSQDGFYAAHPQALTPVLFDLQRVEAVLGPQGTLYGRNTNGGVINFITRDPGFELGGYAKLGAGNYSAINAEAAVNIPLGDRLALRIAGGSEKHDGYSSDGSNDVEAYAGRAKLLFQANDDLRLLLAVDAASRKSVGANYGAQCPPNTGVPACATVIYTPWSGSLPASQSNFSDNSILGASLTVDYDLGWGALTSLTGYKTHDFKVSVGPAWYGGTNNFEYLHPEESRFFTQEVRVSSEADSRIAWVVGAYYSHENQPSYVQFNYYNTILQAFFGLPPNFYQKLDIVSSSYESEALFGDITVPLGERFRFRGGLRLTHESKDVVGTSEAGVLPNSRFGPLQTNEGHSKITKGTWKAGFDFDATPANLLYVTASTGFKSGGVNNLPSIAGLTTYAPETIFAVEVGSKNRFLYDRLQINAAVFHYDYKNFQTFLFYQPTGGPLAGATLFPTVNSQTATFMGGELQATMAITSADRVGLDLNVLNNTFDEYVVALPFSPVFDLSDTDVPLSPDYRVGLSYEHAFRFGNGGELTVGGNFQYVDSNIVTGNYFGSNSYRQPSYHKSGANVTYRTSNSGWTLSAFVRNIEDEPVINTVAGGFPVLQDFQIVNVMIDPPRTFGISVRKDF